MSARKKVAKKTGNRKATAEAKFATAAARFVSLAVDEGAAKKTKTGGKRRKSSSNHVQLRRIDLALDLTPAGAREALASLKGALEGSEGSGSSQLRLDARDLNAIYLYLPVRELKSLVGRLRALVELP